MHLLDLQDIDSSPRRKQPLFDILPKEEQYAFISEISNEILEKYVKRKDGNYGNYALCFCLLLYVPI